MKKALFSLACLLLAACTASTGERPAPDPARPSASVVDAPGASASAPAGGAAVCATDADCVPAECCHASTCGSAAKKPDCSDTMCTRECRPGTFDCGGGGCACRNGRCQAELREQK
ncbi:MAG TPA: hypothetical protein VFS00_26260 [Polyangiaceae bacterium]|nr:hypothetical protein [Polyangiaceae bacterium]